MADPEFDEEQQAHIDRIMARTRDEGRRAGASSAATELADKLGCTVDEAVAKIAAADAAEAANQTEAQRAAAEAAAAVAARDQAVADAAAARAELTNTQALTTGENPVNPKHLAHALALLNLPADADEATRTARIEALRTEVPSFFTTTVAPAPGGFVPPAPVTPPGSSGGGQSAKDRATARFEASKPKSRAA